jgi:hypothetical protein
MLPGRCGGGSGFIACFAEIKDPLDVGLEQGLEYLHQHLFKRKHCEAEG